MPCRRSFPPKIILWDIIDWKLSKYKGINVLSNTWFLKILNMYMTNLSDCQYINLVILSAGLFGFYPSWMRCYLVVSILTDYLFIYLKNEILVFSSLRTRLFSEHHFTNIIILLLSYQLELLITYFIYLHIHKSFQKRIRYP